MKGELGGPIHGRILASLRQERKLGAKKVTGKSLVVSSYLISGFCKEKRKRGTHLIRNFFHNLVKRSPKRGIKENPLLQTRKTSLSLGAERISHQGQKGKIKRGRWKRSKEKKSLWDLWVT